MLGAFKIRSKLAVVLAVPAVALVASVGLDLAQRSAAAGEVMDVARLSRVAETTAPAVSAVQSEIDLDIAYLDSRGATGAGALRLQQASTDRALAGLRAALDDADAHGLFPGSGGAGRQLASVAPLGALRTTVGSLGASTSQVSAYGAGVATALVSLQAEASSLLRQQVRSHQERADIYARVGMGSAAGALVLSLLVLALVATTLTRPLRRIRDVARRAAGEQLPELVEALRQPSGHDADVALEPVGISSRDEIGLLAQDFDRFQGAAAKLAMSQARLLNRGVADKGTAEIFVNLARRNQGLIDHQIEFLDKLEANEADANSLEDLFTLDQLATRMRRNAESLLMLAGTESTRRWERPIPIADVVRSAIAEVKDLSRVDLAVHDETMIIGGIAAEAAHLLAELLENATFFSPPTSRVEVTGASSNRGYVITIADHGIGMSNAKLTEANTLLDSPPVGGHTVQRALGLVVAGRLARQIGIAVELARGPSNGIVARVTVPPALLIPPDDVAGSETTATDGGRGASSGRVPFALGRMESRARITSHRARTQPGLTGAPRGLGAAALSSGPSRSTPARVPAPPDDRGDVTPRGLERHLAVAGVRSADTQPARYGSTPAGGTDPAPPSVTPDGLLRRVPRASLPPELRGSAPAEAESSDETESAQRRPEDVRNLLSRYRSGVVQGRSEQPRENPAAPEEKP